MYFYELHESDDELFTDVLVAHDSEFDEEELLELVLEARDEVLSRFEEDTLVEAIANELERRHGFLHINDARIRAAINVSVGESGTMIAPVDEAAADDRAADEEFRSLLIEVDPEDPR